MIKIHEGRAPGFVSLYWINDLKKFGVMVHQLFNPSTKALGFEYLKGKKRKSIIFSGKPDKLEHAKAVWSLEQEFGVPPEGSPYYKFIKENGG